MELTAHARASADVAVTGCGGQDITARAFLRAELAGVRYIPLADEGAIDADLGAADMLVFIADANDAIDRTRTLAIAEAAHRRGMLVAAVVVPADALPPESKALSTLREAADMVMLVRDPSDITALTAALC